MTTPLATLIGSAAASALGGAKTPDRETERIQVGLRKALIESDDINFQYLVSCKQEYVLMLRAFTGITVARDVALKAVGNIVATDEYAPLLDSIISIWYPEHPSGKIGSALATSASGSPLAERAINSLRVIVSTGRYNLPKYKVEDGHFPSTVKTGWGRVNAALTYISDPRFFDIMYYASIAQFVGHVYTATQTAAPSGEDVLVRPSPTPAVARGTATGGAGAAKVSAHSAMWEFDERPPTRDSLMDHAMFEFAAYVGRHAGLTAAQMYERMMRVSGAKLRELLGACCIVCTSTKLQDAAYDGPETLSTVAAYLVAPHTVVVLEGLIAHHLSEHTPIGDKVAHAYSSACLAMTKAVTTLSLGAAGRMSLAQRVAASTRKTAGHMVMAAIGAGTGSGQPMHIATTDASASSSTASASVAGGGGGASATSALPSSPDQRDWGSLDDPFVDAITADNPLWDKDGAVLKVRVEGGMRAHADVVKLLNVAIINDGTIQHIKRDEKRGGDIYAVTSPKKAAYTSGPFTAGKHGIPLTGFMLDV